MDVLSDVDKLTPDRLTKLLHRKGYLAAEEVTAIRTLASQQTAISSVYHLAVTYSRLPVAAPTRLFLKIPRPTETWMEKEIQFYTTVAPQMQTGQNAAGWLFPLCYDAAYSQEDGAAHLLLEDLSDTHFTIDGDMPPTAQLREQIIDAYARFHAFWWEDPQLGNGVGERLTAQAIDGFLQTAERKHSEFTTQVGETLTLAQRTILERVVTAWPARRRMRVLAGQGLTLVHRDPHPGNFLFPKDAQTHSVKLIDWQSWRVDTGTDDLAYLMACHWPLAAESRVEQELVERYHAQLLRQGVQNYSWEACWYDYRASIVRCLFFLLIAWSPAQWEGGIWWQRIQRGCAAYARWDCEELFAGGG
jgi:thiamine kinase-like enzyme